MPIKKYFTLEERMEGRRRSRVKYNASHRDAIRERNSRYQQENLDKVREWRRNDKCRIRAKFSSLKSRGVRDGLEVTLTFEQFQFLNSLPCDYCGGALPATGYGVDRKDNLQGYIPDNSVPCCYRCNTMKSSYLTYDEMKLIWQRRKEING